MINKTLVSISDSTNPYHNIAREAFLLENTPPDSCILYLWQNDRTVVIGRNQNVWRECRVAELEKDGGHLARRLSGGGAVYHDLGNLCFTFLLPLEDYNVDTQSEVILRAMNSLGLQAVRTGRNDIEIDGRKFSGNAFDQGSRNAMQHGTILMNAAFSDAAKYLSPSADKRRGKGVESVKARMINLTECNPAINRQSVESVLINHFEEIYQCKSERIAEDFFDVRAIETAEARFSSAEWKYGKSPPCVFKTESRFTWGGVEFQFDVTNQTIENCQVYSDAMDAAFILDLPKALNGLTFSHESVLTALLQRYGPHPDHAAKCADIAGLLFM
jgi:lipoate-protein ligase A